MTTRRIYVVRHARAGDRERWTEADRLRPLTPLGHRQARALIRPLRGAGIRRVLSSPFIRCMDTVRPFGEVACVPIEPEDALAEGAPRPTVRALLPHLADCTAICTHGDVIEDLLDLAIHDGVSFAGPLRLAKASVWILDLGPGAKIARARYRPPPTVA